MIYFVNVKAGQQISRVWNTFYFGDHENDTLLLSPISPPLLSQSIKYLSLQEYRYKFERKISGFFFCSFRTKNLYLLYRYLHPYMLMESVGCEINFQEKTKAFLWSSPNMKSIIWFQRTLQTTQKSITKSIRILLFDFNEAMSSLQRESCRKKNWSYLSQNLITIE